MDKIVDYNTAEDAFERRLMFELNYNLQDATQEMERHGQRLIEEAQRLRQNGIKHTISSYMHLPSNMRFIARIEEIRVTMERLGEYRAFRAGGRRSIEHASHQQLPTVSITVTGAELDALTKFIADTSIEPPEIGWTRKQGRGSLNHIRFPLLQAVALHDALLPPLAEKNPTLDAIRDRLKEAI